MGSHRDRKASSSGRAPITPPTPTYCWHVLFFSRRHGDECFQDEAPPTSGTGISVLKNPPASFASTGFSKQVGRFVWQMLSETVVSETHGTSWAVNCERRVAVCVSTVFEVMWSKEVIREKSSAQADFWYWNYYLQYANKTQMLGALILILYSKDLF